jgi:signal transduction histidine kinase
MKIETKFLLSSISVIAVIVACFGGSTFLGKSLQESFEARDDITDEALDVVDTLEIQIRDEVSQLKNNVLLSSSQASMVSMTFDAQDNILANLERLATLLQDSDQVDPLFQHHQQLLAKVHKNHQNHAQFVSLEQSIYIIDENRDAFIETLNSINQTLIAQENKNDQYFDDLTFWLNIARYSGVIFAVFMIFLQYKFTFAPISTSINTLKRKTQEIGSGKLDRSVDIHTGDEIEALAHEFNTMAKHLKDVYDSLEEKVQERTNELVRANGQLKETLVHLKKTQSQLIQTEKLSSLGQLVAGVAHEINNPVNFIFGNLTHVSRYVQDLLALIQCYEQHHPQPHPNVVEFQEELELDFVKQDLTEALDSMQLGTKRIREIVLSLRNFSRLDEAEQKEANIHDGIDSTLMILQSRLKAYPDRPAITIHKHYGNLPLVYCYPGQLNQVFMNILVNAIDALDTFYQAPSATEHQPPELRIDICTQVCPQEELTAEMISTSTPLKNHQKWLKIAIADNGPGIEELTRKRLFDPFFTTKAVGKGTGLGLSISHQIIVDKHGGEIWCNSQPGQGTQFVIVIPFLPFN